MQVKISQLGYMINMQVNIYPAIPEPFKHMTYLCTKFYLCLYITLYYNLRNINATQVKHCSYDYSYVNCNNLLP